MEDRERREKERAAERAREKDTAKHTEFSFDIPFASSEDNLTKKQARLSGLAELRDPDQFLASFYDTSRVLQYDNRTR